jgi:rhodanese-related sulfurtransferase
MAGGGDQRSMKARTTFFYLWALVVLMPVADARETFVKYTDVRDQLSSPVIEPGSISVEEVKAMMDGRKSFYLLDARSKSDYERERIAGAVLSHGEDYYKDLELFKLGIIKQSPDSRTALQQNLKLFDKNAVLVTYCNQKCTLSKNLMKTLQSLGFTNVRWLSGGIDTWREKGYPLVRR